MNSRLMQLLLVVPLTSCHPSAETGLEWTIEDQNYLEKFGEAAEVKKLLGRKSGERLSDAELNWLQNAASKSCQCTKDAPSQKSKCWGDYDFLAKRLVTASQSDACAEAESVDLFGPADDFDNLQTVVTDWGFGACSNEEAEKIRKELEVGC